MNMSRSSWLLGGLMLLALIVATIPAGKADDDTDVSTDVGGFALSSYKEVNTAGKVWLASTQRGSVRIVDTCAIGGRDTCVRRQRCRDGETMQTVYYTAPGGSETFSGVYCPSEAEDGSPQRITNTMVLRALRRVTLPKPVLSIQPPGGKTLVNFETIFSTDAGSLRRTVRLLGHRVQLDITPTAYVWSYGDGTSESTTESGVPWEEGLPMSSYLTHVYEDAQVTMRPSVAVTYGARFRVDGGAWRDVAGTVTSEGAPVDLRVIEGRATLLSGY